MGGHGCISVSANLVPTLCARLHDAWDRIDPIEFARIRDLLAPLHQALSGESNPIPVKAALCMAGLCTGELRLQRQYDGGEPVVGLGHVDDILGRDIAGAGDRLHLGRRGTKQLQRVQPGLTQPVRRVVLGHHQRQVGTRQRDL